MADVLVLEKGPRSATASLQRSPLVVRDVLELLFRVLDALEGAARLHCCLDLCCKSQAGLGPEVPSQDNVFFVSGVFFLVWRPQAASPHALARYWAPSTLEARSSCVLVLWLHAEIAWLIIFFALSLRAGSDDVFGHDG